MKITFGFGFNGGQLRAECDTFEEADSVINYALKRGIVTLIVPAAGGSFQVGITKNEEVLAAAKAQPKAAKAPEVTSVTPSVTPKVTVEAPSATPADAAQAVKDYAAKHGVEKGRELLARFGLKRTNEIKDDNAAAILAAAGE